MNIERHSVKVTFANGDIVYSTLNASKKEIHAYYVGKTFNVGLGPNDNLQKAVTVNFL